MLSFAASSPLRRLALPMLVASMLGWIAPVCEAQATEAKPPSPSGIFESNIDRVFADGRADIRVVFGYDNYEELKNPSDPARAQQFMRYLTNRFFAPITPTPEMASDLGFPVDAQNVKAFGGTTLDGRRMRVVLIWSSLSSSTARNLGIDYSKQLTWSGVALNFMKKSLAESEVMIYVGHSRGGGGPDTYPPETVKGKNAGIQQVDFGYYRRKRPGMMSLEPTLAKAKDSPPFIVWTGCLSHNHFCGWLSSLLGGKDHPTTLVLSTRLTNHVPDAQQITETDESLMAAITMMEALIFRQSQADFEKRLLDCELSWKSDVHKPLWKVTNLPGRKPGGPAELAIEPKAPSPESTAGAGG